MATPETALALLRRSALRPESVASVFLAWPESWAGWREPRPTHAGPGQGCPAHRRHLVARASRRPGRAIREAGTHRGLATRRDGAPGAGGTGADRRGVLGASGGGLVRPGGGARSRVLVVWTVDRSRHGDIARALPLGDPAVRLVTGDAPTAAAVVAFDLPDARAAPSAAHGRRGGAAGAARHRAPSWTASPRRADPCACPALLETVTSEAAARRATVARAHRGAEARRGATHAGAAVRALRPGGRGRRRSVDLWTTASAAPATPPRSRRSPPRRGSTSASGRRTAPR